MYAENYHCMKGLPLHQRTTTAWNGAEEDFGDVEAAAEGIAASGSWVLAAATLLVLAAGAHIRASMVEEAVAVAVELCMELGGRH
ncbi:unnamed protein product [Linum trigynum]|uniref:Uncharacterized protein n=1 Tax=Linum trigynum TaxID=586398 RepID=A0AAV2GDD9_9ROSI